MAKTVKYCYSYIQNELNQKGIEELMSSAEHIIAHVLGGRKTLDNISPEREVTSDQWLEIVELTRKRATGCPVEYVLQKCYFLGHTLYVKLPVFIPKQDTEKFAEAIITAEETKAARKFIEIGCGCGPVCLSILKACPHLHATAVDISEEACQQMQINADRLGLKDRVTVINARAKDLPEILQGEKFDILVSDPPFSSTAKLEGLATTMIEFEDPGSFSAGEDGLDVVKEILGEATKLLQDKGLVWLELDVEHPALLQSHINNGLWKGLHFRKTFKDFDDIPRICQLQYQKP